MYGKSVSFGNWLPQTKLTVRKPSGGPGEMDKWNKVNFSSFWTFIRPYCHILGLSPTFDSYPPLGKLGYKCTFKSTIYKDMYKYSGNLLVFKAVTPKVSYNFREHIRERFFCIGNISTSQYTEVSIFSNSIKAFTREHVVINLSKHLSKMIEKKSSISTERNRHPCVWQWKLAF